MLWWDGNGDGQPKNFSHGNSKADLLYGVVSLKPPRRPFSSFVFCFCFFFSFSLSLSLSLLSASFPEYGELKRDGRSLESQSDRMRRAFAWNILIGGFCHPVACGGCGAEEPWGARIRRSRTRSRSFDARSGSST